MKNNFKEARELCELSQKYVSVELGVSAPTVSEWESGRKTPTVENLLKLKDLYGTTVDYLLGLTDDPGAQAVPDDLSQRRVLKDAANKEKALSLSNRALQIAFAYEVAKKDARDICDIALKPYMPEDAEDSKAI